jgi:hypothetical protein
MSDKRIVPAVVKVIAAAILLIPCRAEGQSTAGWLTYNGTNFAFNYPPDWTISAQSATNVQLVKGTVAGFSVTYTTALGTDIDQALTSVETGTQQFAAANGYTLSPETFVPDTAGGNVSVLLHLTGSGLKPIDVWAEARLITGAISLTELWGSPDEVFTDEVTVAWPLSRSVHALAGLSVVGSWSASVPAVGGIPFAGTEQYQVKLVFNSNNTYTYDVQQTDAPAWSLHVTGTYTSALADENQDKYPLTLQLSPQNVTPTGISSMQTEMARLAGSGLPVTNSGGNSFLADLDADGSLELVRPEASPVRFQKAAATSGLSFVGTMSQLASGSGWDTKLTLVNTGSTSGEAKLNFWDEPGTPLLLPLTFPQTPATAALQTSTLDQTLAPNASLLLDSQGSGGSPSLAGSAQLFTNGSVDGFATFHDTLTGQEAVSPLESRNAASYILPFDNTGGLTTGLAMANVASTPAAIPVIIRDDTGTTIGSATVSLPGYGHTAFMLASQYSVIQGKRGTVEFDTPSAGQISVLGLRVAPIGTTRSFATTTLPILANVTPGSGSMAQVAPAGRRIWRW